MIELNEEQRQELSAPEPLAFDPQTRSIYVLVQKEVYDRLRSLLDDEGLSKREVGILVERAMQEYDAGDPSLSLYQQD